MYLLFAFHGQIEVTWLTHAWLLFLHMQTPVNFGSLTTTANFQLRLPDHCSAWTSGFCYDDLKLYCVQELDQRWHLSVYHIFTGSNSHHGVKDLRLRDTVVLGDGLALLPLDCQLCIDRHTRRIYIACGEIGVMMFLYGRGRPTAVRILRCVRYAVDVAVNSKDTVFVCDSLSRSVALVNVKTDTVLRELSVPSHVRNNDHSYTPPCVCAGGDGASHLRCQQSGAIPQRQPGPWPRGTDTGGTPVGVQFNHRWSLQFFPHGLYVWSVCNGQRRKSPWQNTTRYRQHVITELCCGPVTTLAT